MSKSVSRHITSCTVSWENHDDILSAATTARRTSVSSTEKTEFLQEKQKKKPRFPAAFFIFGGATQI